MTILRHRQGPTATGAASNGAAARFFRVLGDPTRLEILGLLLDRPHTVGELVAATGAAQPKVSNHLACLKWCRFAEAERDGRHVTYTIADERIGAVLAAARDIIEDHREHLASCRRIGPDWI
ncbi:MAG: ArsR/SmtB family transcription factor [Actinomycetota bacterium]